MPLINSSGVESGGLEEMKRVLTRSVFRIHLENQDLINLLPMGVELIFKVRVEIQRPLFFVVVCSKVESKIGSHTVVNPSCI